MRVHGLPFSLLLLPLWKIHEPFDKHAAKIIRFKAKIAFMLTETAKPVNNTVLHIHRTVLACYRTKMSRTKMSADEM